MRLPPRGAVFVTVALALVAAGCRPRARSLRRPSARPALAQVSSAPSAVPTAAPSSNASTSAEPATPEDEALARELASALGTQALALVPDAGALPSAIGNTGEASSAGAGALGACVARVRTSLPAELRGAFAVLGYGPHEDACRLDLAVRMRDAALCDTITLGALRSSCRARAAVALENASGCPTAALDRGRDPVCVALASRSFALCAAGAPADRARCVAIARGRPGFCEALPDVLRAACVSDVEALTPLVGALRGTMPVLGTAALTIETVTASTAPRDGGAGLAPVEPAGFARGGWIATEPDGALSFVLTDPARGWPSVTGFAIAPRERPVLSVRVRIPPRVGRAQLLDLRLVTAPDGLVFEWVPTVPATVRLDRVPRQRGDVVGIALDAHAMRGGELRRITLEARTFVRDIVPLEELMRGDAPELDAPATP